MIKCKDCFNMIVLHAMTESKCIVCEKKFMSPCKPARKVCKDCAIKCNMCPTCGKELPRKEVND